jgi:AhpD family alkylhydroperoxidase
MPTINPTKDIDPTVKKEVTEALGFVPTFMHTLPPAEQRLFWSVMRDFQMSDKTALNGKTKELIGLGVASQIPCHYCVLFHTEAARLNGATEHELQEAIFMAGFTRFGSTVLNGVQVDQNTFDKELRDIVAHIKKQMAAGGMKH